MRLRGQLAPQPFCYPTRMETAMGDGGCSQTERVRRRPKVVAVLCAASVCLALASGCGSDSSSVESGPPPGPEGAVSTGSAEGSGVSPSHPSNRAEKSPKRENANAGQAQEAQPPNPPQRSQQPEKPAASPEPDESAMTHSASDNGKSVKAKPREGTHVEQDSPPQSATTVPKGAGSH